MTGWSEDGLDRAWRALSRQVANEEWRFVHLTDVGHVRVEAGCHFPAHREALIVSFPGSLSVKQAQLPDGMGFDIALIEGAFVGRVAIALVRRAEGSPEIFAVMAVDIVRALQKTVSSPQDDVFTVFIERVREWQAFMARRHRPLSPDAQIGLMGELWMLLTLMDSPLGRAALDCWLGPLNAAQDFRLNGGAIEVKSSAGTGAFLARINSIEQLDSDRSPKFLCALRFEEDQHGVSLVDMVSTLRCRYTETDQRRAFDALLLVMGYLDEHVSQYGRGLILKDVRVFKVNDDMPHLTRATLPAAVRSAAYVLDLDAVGTPTLGMSDMMHAFGLS